MRCERQESPEPWAGVGGCFTVGAGAVEQECTFPVGAVWVRSGHGMRNPLPAGVDEYTVDTGGGTHFPQGRDGAVVAFGCF